MNINSLNCIILNSLKTNETPTYLSHYSVHSAICVFREHEMKEICSKQRFVHERRAKSKLLWRCKFYQLPRRGLTVKEHSLETPAKTIVKNI